MIAFSSHPNLFSLRKTAGSIRKTVSSPELRTVLPSSPRRPLLSLAPLRPLSPRMVNPKSSPKKTKTVLKSELMYATLLGSATAFIFGEHRHLPDMHDLQHAAVAEGIELSRRLWEGDPLLIKRCKRTVLWAVLLPLMLRYSWVLVVEHVL